MKVNDAEKIKVENGGSRMTHKKKNMMVVLGAVLACILMFEKGTLAFAADTIVPAYINANESTANASTYQFQKEASANALSIPIQISNVGTVELEVTVKSSDAQSFNVILSNQANYNDPRDYLDISKASNGQTATLSFYAKSSCQWYLHVFGSKKDSNPDISISVKAYQKGLPSGVTAGSGNLKNKKWASFCLGNFETGYYKIKLASSGCVKFELTGENADIALLNGKKKEITSLSDEKTQYFGLKKGTYYIRVKNSSTDAQIYKMRYTFEKMKVAKNVKQSKAVDLKKGKTAKSMFLSTAADYHWYKLDLPKDKKVKLNVQAKGDVYRLRLLNTASGYDKEIALKSGKTKKTLSLKKGTYYILLSGQGGTYSIQWK